VKYVSADTKVAAAVLTQANSFFPFSRALRPDVTERELEIFIAPSEDSFRELTRGVIPDWGTACAFPDRGMIVLKSPRIVDVWREHLEVILRHELVHIYLHRIAHGGVPRWFDEGSAAYMSGEWGLRDNLDLAIAVVSGRLIPLKDMSAWYPSAESKVNLFYLESYSTVAFLTSHLGKKRMMGFFHSLLTARSFESALYQQTGMTLPDFEARWQGWLKRSYHPLYLLGRSEFLFGILIVIMFVAYFVKRRRWKSALAEMDDHIENGAWEDKGLD